MSPPVHSLKLRYGEPGPSTGTQPQTTWLVLFPQYTHYQRNYVPPEKPQEVEDVDGGEEEEEDSSPSTSDTSSSDSSTSEDEDEEEDEDDRCSVSSNTEYIV